MKNELQTYNTKDTLLVITSFPNPVDGKFGKREFNAVGEHSERRLPYIADKRKVLVLAEDTGTQKYFSPMKNILVARTWKKGNIFSLLRMGKFILEQNNITSILVQFEFNMLGGTPANLALILVLMMLRLAGKKVTFEMHQVLTDIGTVQKHINITHPVMKFLFNRGLAVFYTTIGILSNHVIVFEQEMKDRLQQFVPGEKIEVLCLSVDKQSMVEKQKARKMINKILSSSTKSNIKTFGSSGSFDSFVPSIKADEFVLLVFGYINGYKGIDWILEALKDVNKKANGKPVRLLIAGGENPYLKDKPFYQNFYASIMKEIKKYPHVTYANFVPDDQINLYYSAADLVVMPYIAFMSASGPFSRALAHEKPVIISDVLSDYSKSADFQKAMLQANVTKADIIFPLQKEALLTRIHKAQTDKTYYTKIAMFAQSLASLRNIETISASLDALLFPDETVRATLTIQPTIA